MMILRNDFAWMTDALSADQQGMVFAYSAQATHLALSKNRQGVFFVRPVQTGRVGAHRSLI